MDSLSRAFAEHYCHYDVMSSPGGHSENATHALPLFLYPRSTEPRLYNGSYPPSAPLVPYLGPFHTRFGVYECALEPAFIQKRNERERQRVKCVNQGYAKLRDHLPGDAADKRMSKVETLRAAIRYINHLQRLVEGRENPNENCTEEDEPQGSVPNTAHPKNRNG